MFKTIFLFLLYATPVVSQTLYQRNKEIMDSVRKVADSATVLRTAINSVSGGLSPNGNGSGLTGLTKTQVGLSNVDNTSDANKPISGATQIALDAKQATITNGSISNAMLANGAVANLSGVNTGDQTNITGNAATVTTNANLTGPITSVGNATTITAASVTNAMIVSMDVMKLTIVSGATSSTTGGMTTVMGTNGIYTCTPTAAVTFNASGGTAGQRCTFIITTSGVSSFVVTFGSSFTAAGTLSTGTTSGKKFCVSFLCTTNGNWTEISRTGAM